MGVRAYKTKKKFSAEKIRCKDLWHKICEHYTDKDGIRHCYTGGCPFAKKYGCYQYYTYDEFEHQYHDKIKKLRSEIIDHAIEIGVAEDEEEG